MNTANRIQKRAAGPAAGQRAASNPRLARLFTPMRRRGMFAPLAAFASLAGITGLPFVSL